MSLYLAQHYLLCRPLDPILSIVSITASILSGHHGMQCITPSLMMTMTHEIDTIGFSSEPYIVHATVYPWASFTVLWSVRYFILDP